MLSLAKLYEDKIPAKKDKNKVKSRKQGAEERKSVKIFLSKTIYCEKYEDLEKENPAAWVAENDLKPLKVFEALLGENFKQLRKETMCYSQRCGNSDFSLSLAEVKCAVGILILSSYHRLPTRRNY